MLKAQQQDLANVDAKCWPGFASKNAGKQWKAWSPGDTVTKDRKAQALFTFCFDALFDNADRRASNPNLLVKGGQLRAIDHELSFAFTSLIIAPAPPWTTGGLEWMIGGDQ